MPFETLVEEPVADTSVPAYTRLQEQVAALITQKEALAAAKAAEAAAKEQVDALELSIPDLMQACGLIGPDGHGSFTTADGRKVHIRTNTFANVVKADREAFHLYLRANGFGELIQESVNAQTLTAWAKEQLSAGATLPPQVKTSHKTVAVLTAAKGGA